MLKRTSNISLQTSAFLIWVGFIVICYIQNFCFSGNQENVVLDEISIGILLLFISLLSGNRLLNLFRLQDISVLEEILFSLGVGMALYSTAIFILGLFKILYFWTLILLLAGLTLIAVSNYGYVKKLLTTPRGQHPDFSSIELIIIFFIVIFTGLVFVNTLIPPISRDALIHHLAVPKLYIKHHGIINIPFSSPSYYPPFMEMLYVEALLLSSDILAKLLHFFFYLGSLLFTYALGKRLLSRKSCLFAVLLFGSLPVVCQVSSSAYSDLGLAFYSLGGFLALFRWFQTRLNRWFCLSALMTGWAIGCKYNGLIILVVFAVSILFILVQRKVALKVVAKNIFLFLFLACIINSLWLGKNYFFSGNPVYPLASSIIGKPWLPNHPKFSQYQIRNMLHGESLWDQIKLPWNISIKTKSIARHELDGNINPIFLIFLPLLFFIPSKAPGIKWAGYMCLLYFLFFWSSARVRLRYLMPIYPLLGIITAYIIARLEIRWKRTLLAVPICFVILLNLYWVLIYTSTINPITFLVGQETRSDFLNRHISSYPVFQYINKHLPQDSRIMFLYGGKHGNDGYYLNRDYFCDYLYLSYTIKEIIKQATTPDEMRKEFTRMGITHFFINWKRLQMDFSSSLSAEKNCLFKSFCQSYLNLEFKHRGAYLYRLL